MNFNKYNNEHKIYNIGPGHGVSYYVTEREFKKNEFEEKKRKENKVRENKEKEEREKEEREMKKENEEAKKILSELNPIVFSSGDKFTFNPGLKYRFYGPEDSGRKAKKQHNEENELVYKGILLYKGVIKEIKPAGIIDILIFLQENGEIKKINSGLFDYFPEKYNFLEINNSENKINSIIKEINDIYDTLKLQKNNPDIDINFLKKFMKSYIYLRIQKLEINESQKNNLKQLILDKNKEI